MTYALTHQTICHLRKMHQLLLKSANWCQVTNPDEKAFTLCGAFYAVGVDDTAYQHNLDKDDIYPGNLRRGEIPEPVWFVRQAMNKIAPEFGGLISKWDSAAGRTHEEVLDLIISALDLAKTELSQIIDLGDGPDMSDVVLHRWGDKYGKTLCAMTALSQMLGHFPLTDNPEEVDPGLNALVNLLNDRASDKARQLLVSRLIHIPNTGRTEICALIADVFFPRVLEACQSVDENNSLADCNSRRAKAKAYSSLGERLLEPGGSGSFASGCITLAAALKAKDPTAQDILAVSAASQKIRFETDEQICWFELLRILDSILGLEKIRYAHLIEKPSYYDLIIENEKRPFEEIYDFGIRVQWFPDLVGKFPDRLEEIAKKILDEVAEIGSTTIFMHRFPFGDEEVMIVTSWDDDLDMLFADADLVAYFEPVGEVDLSGDGEASPVMGPVPASNAETIH